MRAVPVPFLAVVLGAAPAAALEVVSTVPSPYELHVPTTLSAITVTFDAPPVVPDPSLVRVSGTMSGLHPGSVQVAGNTLTFVPQGAWLAGELVNVNLHRDIATGAGEPLTDGHYFAFTIRSGVAAAEWSAPVVRGAADVPYFIYGGDLDDDGTPDVAAPNEGTNDFSVWLNPSGTGALAPRQEYPVGDTPSSCFGEDFDDDGHVDLATADIASSTVTVSRNAGDGSFLPGTSYPAGSTTRQVHGGDFDGDNDVDLCATSLVTDEVRIFLNDGTGTFVAAPPISDVADGPFAIRTGDFDLDGRLDIAVACQNADTLTVLMNQGGGTFASTGRFKIGDGPWCLNGNDMDGDGDFDLVTVASFGRRVQVLFNDGAGGFPTKFGQGTDVFPLGVFVADLDGDGDMDVTSSNFSSGTVGIYLNAGDGTIALDATLPVDRSGSYTWAHDLDLDGDLDLSVVDELADSLYVFFNEPAVDAPSVPPGAGGIALAARPNPARAAEGTVLHLSGLEGPVTIDVFGVDGRRLRRLHRGPAPAAGIAWDGRDAAGRPLPAGAYVVAARGAGGTASATVRLLR